MFTSIPIRVPDASGEPIPHPDGVTETRLRYQGGPYILDTLGHQRYPFGSFAIRVDRNGQGHLQSYIDPSSATKIPRHDTDLIISDWAERTRYLIDGKGWTQLSLEGATKLWSEPRKHVVNEHPFYSFDAYSTSNGERNLYHLDLGFKKDGIIMAYRVRGIGISKPEWIVDPQQPWVVEHVEQNGDYE